MELDILFANVLICDVLYDDVTFIQTVGNVPLDQIVLKTMRLGTLTIWKLFLNQSMSIGRIQNVVLTIEPIVIISAISVP